jgi:hypothetical protein
MSKKLYEETDIQNIADSIREKNGLTTTYKVSEMAQAIKDIQSGSGSDDNNTLNNFISGSITAVESNATTVRLYAFFRLSSLTTVSLPNATDIGSSAFTSCTALTSVSLPKVKIINTYGFQKCSALISINLPSVTAIYNSGFQECSNLSVVDLGVIKTIAAAAFYSCTSLNKLIIRGSTVCSLNSINALNGSQITAGTGTIYVPDDLVDDYKSATNWSTFADQIKPLSEYIGE